MYVSGKCFVKVYFSCLLGSRTAYNVVLVGMNQVSEEGRGRRGLSGGTALSESRRAAADSASGYTVAPTTASIPSTVAASSAPSTRKATTFLIITRLLLLNREWVCSRMCLSNEDAPFVQRSYYHHAQAPRVDPVTLSLPTCGTTAPRSARRPPGLSGGPGPPRGSRRPRRRRPRTLPPPPGAVMRLLP